VAVRRPGMANGDQSGPVLDRETFERVQATATETAFREFVVENLPLDGGERVLSAGCGPGHEPAALAERVGPSGDVLGVDVDEAMLAAARERCRDRPQVSLARADATDLPVPDGAVDLVVAKQMLQYLDDAADVLEEFRRVLAPGGHLAVGTGVNSTSAMYEPTERVERANELYFSGGSGGGLGTDLVALLPEAGFSVEAVDPFGRVTDHIDAQIEHGMDVQRSFLAESEEFEERDVAAWERDLREADEAGQFLFCGLSLLYVARAPE
jgi:SAM-dependent methyltransferase